MVKVEGMNTALDESDFTQFDGALLTGSQVLAAIQQYKDSEGVVFSVKNKGDSATVYYYSNGLTSTTDKDNKTSVTIPAGASYGTAGAHHTVRQIPWYCFKKFCDQCDRLCSIRSGEVTEAIQ